MDIPYRFDPLGTLGAEPLPTGWHAVEKVSILRHGRNDVVYQAPEELLPAWDGSLDVLFDVEIPSSPNTNTYATIYAFYNTGYLLNIGSGGGITRIAICGEKYESGIFPCYATIRCRAGVITGYMNGTEVMRVPVPQKPAETRVSWLRIQTVSGPGDAYLRRSHYFSHALRYELIPCEDDNGQRGVYITGNKELVVL